MGGKNCAEETIGRMWFGLSVERAQISHIAGGITLVMFAKPNLFLKAMSKS